MKDHGLEHVWAYYMHKLGEADYQSKYDAVERNLLKAWHVGAYYNDRLWSIMDKLAQG